MNRNRYRELLSPEAVSKMPHPEAGKALLKDKIVSEEEALQEIAEIVLNAKNPVIFTPARVLLWTWEDGAPEKAKVLRKLAKAIGAEILPILDLRPDYPQMRTAVEINPYHGDLVIGHNKYDLAIFMGIDCPYADVALKIIKDGTDIYTIALCAKLGHVDATLTLCKAGLEKIEELIEVITRTNEERKKKSVIKKE